MAGTVLEPLFSGGSQTAQNAMTQRFMPGGGGQIPTGYPPGGGMQIPGSADQQPGGGAMGANPTAQAALRQQPQYGDGTNAPLPPPPQIHSPGRGLFGMFPNPGAANRDAIDNWNNQAGYADYRNKYDTWQQQKQKQADYDVGEKAAGEAATGYASETGNEHSTETATQAVIRSLKHYSPGIEKNPAALLTATKLLEPLIGKDVTERLSMASKAQTEAHSDEHQDKQFEHSDESADRRARESEERQQRGFSHSDELADKRSVQAEKLADERAARSDRHAAEVADRTDRRSGERDAARELRDEVKAVETDSTIPPDQKPARIFHVRLSRLSDNEADQAQLSDIKDKLSADPKDPMALTALNRLNERWKREASVVYQQQRAATPPGTPGGPDPRAQLDDEYKNTVNGLNGLVNGIKGGGIAVSQPAPSSTPASEPSREEKSQPGGFTSWIENMFGVGGSAEAQPAAQPEPAAQPSAPIPPGKGKVLTYNPATGNLE